VKTSLLARRDAAHRLRATASFLFSKLFDRRPGRDEVVIGPRVLGQAAALAERVHAIGELANGLTLGFDGAEHSSGRRFPVLAQRANQLMQGLPARRAIVGARSVVGRILGGPQQLDLAAAATQYARRCQRAD